MGLSPLSLAVIPNGGVPFTRTASVQTSPCGRQTGGEGWWLCTTWVHSWGAELPQCRRPPPTPTYSVTVPLPPPPPTPLLLLLGAASRQDSGPFPEGEGQSAPPRRRRVVNAFAPAPAGRRAFAIAVQQHYLLLRTTRVRGKGRVPSGTAQGLMHAHGVRRPATIATLRRGA